MKLSKKVLHEILFQITLSYLAAFYVDCTYENMRPFSPFDCAGPVDWLEG